MSPEQLDKLRSLGYTGGGSAGAGPLDDRTLPDPRTHVRNYERLQRAMLARGPAAEAALREIEEIARADPGNPYAHFALGGLAYREAIVPNRYVGRTVVFSKRGVLVEIGWEWEESEGSARAPAKEVAVATLGSRLAGRVDGVIERFLKGAR